MLIFFVIITLTLLVVGLYRETRGTYAHRALKVWGAWVTVLAWLFWWELGEHTGELPALVALITLSFIALFQVELKRLLASLDPTPRQMTRRVVNEEQTRRMILHEVILAANSLSKRKEGALIVIEQSADLTEFLKDGVEIDARLDANLLHAIFCRNGNDFHDGAVVIRRDKIWQAKAFLSMPHSTSLSQEYGTRHLAAVGVTEETDAVVVVVSEERGSISVAYAGTLQECKDRRALETKLERLVR